jgi:acetolactate synthase-1/2/3 large subunit
MREMTAGAQILDVLEEFGVDTLFGIPGGAVSSLYGGLLDRPRMRIVNAKHETGAVFLAMGYSMATDQPGVVLTTSGPAISNALTGLSSAFYEHVPLLMLSGEVSTTVFGRGAFQEGSPSELDVLSMVRRITKFASQVTRPGTAAMLTRKALSTSLSGPCGPSFLSLPLNVSSSTIIEAAPVSGTVCAQFNVDAEGCRRAMDLLLDAKRPLIVAGSGARSAASRSALAELAELTGAPVAVSPKGKGVIPEDHPLYIGVLGFGGHESVIDYLAEGVDVLLVCGSRLSDFTTNGWSPLLAASTAFIQVDIDISQLGRNYTIDLGLVGPTDLILHSMICEAKGQVAPRWLGLKGVEVQPVRASEKGMLTTIDVVLTMNELCPRDAVFTSDIGEHMSIALHYLKIDAEKEFVICLGLGSMGSGVGTAIGWQMGAPSRRVYAICGDGGFLMHGSELATAVQHHVPVTIVIANDSRLNMCHHGMHDLLGETPDFTTQLIDFAAIARGMGADGIVIHTREELVEALSAPPVDRPMVLDVRIDPDIRLDGSQRISALKQFSAPDHAMP